MRKIPQKDRARSCQSEKRGSKPRHICITHHIGSTPPGGCVLACVVSDCASTENSSIASVPRVLACWHSDRPTWDMKNILYIWFLHFTITEKDRCLNYSLSLYFNKKDSPCWQLTQGSRYGNHARSLETSWWIGNKNCQILRRTHSKLRYM